jgi:hypothetical protein
MVTVESMCYFHSRNLAQENCCPNQNAENDRENSFKGWIASAHLGGGCAA